MPFIFCENKLCQSRERGVPGMRLEIFRRVPDAFVAEHALNEALGVIAAHVLFGVLLQAGVVTPPQVIPEERIAKCRNQSMNCEIRHVFHFPLGM